MMSRFLLTIVSLLSSAIMPLTAHAYLTPDQVLDDEDFSARFYEPPPSKREIDDVVREQQERSAERREAEWAAAHPEEEDATHEAAPDEEMTDEDSDIEDLIKALEQYNSDQAAADEEVADDSVTLTAGEKRDMRLLERLRGRDAADVIAAQETLHSGAPLTPTGPTTVLVTLAVAAAIGETWRRVRKIDKKEL